MLLIGDLGFSSLVLVVSIIIPLFGFFIRRKWRLSIVRQAEIKRLMILASEEAARAELEASIGYGSVPVSLNYHQCAVCYCPTTTRCARCKAVRYCSTQCQVIHWRQGHKKECYPAAVAIHQNHGEGSDCDSGQKVTGQHQIGDGFESKEKQHAEPTESSSKESALHNSTTEPALSSSTSCSAVLLEKDDDIKVEFQADGEGRSIASESSSTSFSGFSSSVTGSESSDDVSVCESVGSNEPCRLEISSSADDSKLDTLWTASGVNNVDQTNLSSPKFASLVDSVDKFSKLNASNQMKPDQGGEIQCRASGSSSCISDMYEGSTSEVRTLSSGFWGRTLEPVVSTNDVNDEAFQSNPKESGESASLDPGSSLHFSFSLSQNASSLPPQGLKVKAAKLDDAPRSASGYTQLSNGVTLPENVDLDAPNVSSSSSSNSECANHVECGSTNVSPIPKPREAINRDVPLISSLSSSCSEKSDSSSVINGPSTSHVLKSSDAYSSSARVHVVPNAKSGNFGGVHANAATLPKVSSSSDSTHGLKTSMRKIADQFRGSKLPKHYPLGVGNEDSGNYNDKVLFSYESFVKLYSGSKANLQPCGLVNCGNSCYANAILQCLTFTPPLTAYFLQGLHSKACAKKEWCFTCDLENLILKAKEGKSPLSPKGILSQLQNICGQLVQGKEEDAHEFLRYVIDVMQFDCLKKAGVRSSGCSEEETTLIGLTFGGFLRSKIMCVKCQGKSERYERMMDLTVEIEGDIETLEEALHRFTRTEILDGENKYQCGRCNSYEKAKKKLTISEAPNVLTIALKRFQSGKFGKLNKAIQFPEILNLAPYMSGTSDNSPIYRLYGVVVHLDIMNAAFSGHYVCYVKNAQNKWFKIDDSKVTSSELGNVLTKGAYMLFYARCSPRAPRSIRSRSKSILSKMNSKNYPKSSSTHPDSSGSIESFCSKYNRLQKILEEDSSSDTSSLFSSNSDYTSSCTDSTRDDSLDSVFGDSDASSSSSSSPLYSKHSPLADLDRYGSGSPEMDPLFHSDTSKQCRDVGSYSNSSSFRETDSELLGRVNSLKEVYFRKSLKKRTN
ncbi:Ubiquitin carboxyl-terminal hydrolase 16 -like protein [Gossypium arboreum]|uniref:ubiquitinyl hydrolase 1 n=2 Tax=Gossypium arboreum TaxID=29729 RepID=A0A0B0NKH2_GOSAR|nr:ubiquitin carboxyl-terminal hydrolase 16-like [Gossypium arboreum]KAK5824115.1 hypothetical protein PVK06_018878 [Gossypium arboreum]KHG13290.1 Ubiquitin carboxyl-terminal hydrolase 16 -like protein [Gossypium arboreum]